MPPKGKRRADALVTRDAFELLKRVDGENEDIDEARVRPPLKLSRSRAYDLLGRARSAVLRSQNETNKKASEVNVKRWYEAAPEPVVTSAEVATIAATATVPPDVQPVVEPDKCSDVSTLKVEPKTVADPEFITLPDGTKRRIRPQEPTEDVYEWSHVMDYSVFRVKTPWRQAQLIAQWKENEVLGGKHVNLRGKSKSGPCFGSCPTGNCTCNDREDF
jgi:hypothetical protein